MSQMFYLPFTRLPPGYCRTLRGGLKPPVHPRKAATLVLLRRGADQGPSCSCGGMEVLLLKRTETARFIPGAYVFPGGRLEEGDARRGPHLTAFKIAALRETFEETGILLSEGDPGCTSYRVGDESEGARLRQALNQGKISFGHVLESLRMTLDTGCLTLIGHWVTPVRERYRYDTNFFATEVPAGCEAYPDGTELVESAWLTPHAALALNVEGKLPMVLPTIETLRALSSYSDPAEALFELGRREIPRLLPRVEEAGDGVRMILNDTSADS